MKIDFKSLERTNLAFPAEFKGKTTDALDVFITYRHGYIKIFIDEKLHITTSQDNYDIGGSISDKELLVVLQREKLVDDA